MSPSQRTQAERSAATRDSIVAVARDLFAREGYAAVSLDDVLARLPVTKGALYHHFGDKRGLFRAVVIDAQAELAVAVTAAGEAAAEPWAALEAACDAFFDVLARPGLMRLVCSEAGLVLPYEEWNAIDEAHGAGALRRFYRAAREAGCLRDGLDEAATVRLLSGAIYYGVDWAMAGEAPEDRLRRARDSFRQILRALETGEPGATRPEP